MKVGDNILKKEGASEDDFPIFIWTRIFENGNALYVINHKNGIGKEKLQEKFPDAQLVIPNHAKFKIISEAETASDYILSEDNNYEPITSLITVAHDNRAIKPLFCSNAAYVFCQIFYTGGFVESKYCTQAQEKIENDKYTLIKKLSSITDEEERRKQNARNVKHFMDVHFIPRKFVLLKIISVLKDIAAENFPAEDENFSNSIIETLCLGMFLNFVRENKERIKNLTLNYSKQFPEDFKTFGQFVSMLHKFEDEIQMYQEIEKGEHRLELEALMLGRKLPDRDKGKGIIMKFLEFDLAFWQRLILLDIVNDVPVKKPYAGGYSESHKYMLLLPFFQWVAPHHFPKYNDKRTKAATFQKNMVERMKRFIQGKIF